MLELYIDDRGEVALENLEQLMAAYPQYAQRAIVSALKSEGFRLRGIMQQAMLTGTPPGKEWKALNPHTDVLRKGKKGSVKNWKMEWKQGPDGKKKRVRVTKRAMALGDAARTPLARLRGGLRYVFDDDQMMLRVGFVNPRWEQRMLKLMGVHHHGYKTKVTPRMRRYLFALGVPLAAETTELETPARPLVEPIFKAERQQVFRNLATKFMDNIIRYEKQGLR